MTKLTKLFLPALITAFIVAGCAEPQDGAVDDELYDENQNATENTAIQTDNGMNNGMNTDMNKAIAVIHSNDMNVDGWLTFTDTNEGVRVQGEFSGFSHGMHAMHIHVYGDCSADDYSSAGPHLEFQPMPEDAPITGNLGEFSAGANAMIDTVITAINFENIIGRAVIVHENGNNLSPPPTGNAGPRIACGVIGYANTGNMNGTMNNMEM